MVEDGTVEQYNELVESIAKTMNAIYGRYWNFEIDLVQGEHTKNFVLRVKVYKREQ